MSSPKRILLVEDDPEIRCLIVGFLTAGAFEVIEADSVSAAMQKLSSDGPFDLAILDFWLGRNHAISIMDAIVADYDDLPIVMISGGSRKLDLAATESVSAISGARAFLQKPFRKAEFLKAVDAAMT